MKNRTFAMILAAAVTAGTTASADPQAVPVATTGSRADLAPDNITLTSDHATTRPPITVDTRLGRVRVVVDHHDVLAGGDAVCMTACARTAQIDGRPLAEPL